ncbi:MAG: redox-regulated ATPase YchF [Thermoprotei archaeon]|nr:redox-regulated ATPase YchF [Thermoprotei archaeon]
MVESIAGIVGPPNVGKSTFFAAATLVDVKIASYPFTTIEPNVGVGYVKVKCVCKEFNVKDNPRNSVCIEGYRFVPVTLIDVAGLVPGAWKGRGLGNQFLDHVRRASVLLLVVDASGSTDAEGRKVKPGTHDPREDVKFLEKELDMWIYQMLKKDWDKVVRLVEVAKRDVREVLFNRLSGLGIKVEDIAEALRESDLEVKRIGQWTDEDITNFIRNLRGIAKPEIIVANKADLPQAEDNISLLKDEYEPKYKVIPTSAEAELALRKAAKAKLIKYIPGEKEFEIVNRDKLNERQRRALEYIRENVLEKWGSTGVQDAINTAFLEVLGMVVVFPVEDENKLTDHKGNVLPDAFLMPRGSKVIDLARKIHSELAEKFVSAIDVRTKRRLGGGYILKNRDVIKIIAGR